MCMPMIAMGISKVEIHPIGCVREVWEIHLVMCFPLVPIEIRRWTDFLTQITLFLVLKNLTSHEVGNKVT